MTEQNGTNSIQGQGQEQEQPQAEPFSLMSYQTHVTELIDLPNLASQELQQAQEAYAEMVKLAEGKPDHIRRRILESANLGLEQAEARASKGTNPLIVAGLNALHSDVQKLGIIAIAFDGADTLTREREYRKAIDCLHAWALANGIVKKLPSRGGGGPRNNGTRGGYVKVVDQSKLDAQPEDTRAKVEGAIKNGVKFDTAKQACDVLGVYLPADQSGTVYLRKAGLELTQDKPTA